MAVSTFLLYFGISTCFVENVAITPTCKLAQKFQEKLSKTSQNQIEHYIFFAKNNNKKQNQILLLVKSNFL